MIISYITYITSHLGYTTSHAPAKTSQMPLLIVASFTWLLGAAYMNRSLPTQSHNVDSSIAINFFKPPIANYISLQQERQTPASCLCNTSCTSSAEHVSCARTCKVGPGRFILLSHKIQSAQKQVATRESMPTIQLCSTRTKHLRIDLALIPLMGFAAQKTKKILLGCEQKTRSNLWRCQQ